MTRKALKSSSAAPANASIQGTCIFSLADNELFGYQIHAIDQRRHDRYVSNGVERTKVRKRDRVKNEMDWAVPQRGIFIVNPADACFDLFTQRLIFLDASADGALTKINRISSMVFSPARKLSTASSRCRIPLV